MEADGKKYFEVLYAKDPSCNHKNRGAEFEEITESTVHYERRPSVEILDLNCSNG